MERARVSPAVSLPLHNAHMRRFIVPLISLFFLFTLFRIVPFYYIGWSDDLVIDWNMVYYPALTAVDPYSVYGFFNPPWLIWLLSPLALLGQSDSYALWVSITLLLTIRCVYAMGGNWLSAVLTIISPGFLVMLINGQMDALVLLGLLIGSWGLILIKPQIAGMALAYQVIAERRVDHTAVALLIVSFAVCGLWLTRLPDGLHTQVNIAPFPYGLPVGAVLFGLSLIRRDIFLAGLSTYFFVPYIAGGSLVVYSAIVTSRYGRLTAVAFSALLWLLAGHWFT